MCQYYLGNYREALEALKHLHNQMPGDLRLVYRIGMINLDKLDNPQEALQYFTIGKKLFKENLTHVYGAAFQIVMNPRDVPDIYFEIFKGRAVANTKVGDYEEAITDCNWAIYLRPENGDGYYLRARVNVSSLNYNAVCDDLSKARQLGVEEASADSRRFCRMNSSTAVK